MPLCRFVTCLALFASQRTISSFLPSAWIGSPRILIFLLGLMSCRSSMALVLSVFFLVRRLLITSSSHFCDDHDSPQSVHADSPSRRPAGACPATFLGNRSQSRGSRSLHIGHCSNLVDFPVGLVMQERKVVQQLGEDRVLGSPFALEGDGFRSDVPDLQQGSR